MPGMKTNPNPPKASLLVETLTTDDKIKIMEEKRKKKEQKEKKENK